jgi:hypothetical protein
MIRIVELDYSFTISACGSFKCFKLFTIASMINLLYLFQLHNFWPLVSISKEERSKLISMLSASIRQIIAEDKSEWEIKGGNVITFDFKC